MASTLSTDRRHGMIEIRDPMPHSVLSPIGSSFSHRISVHHPAYDHTRLAELSAFDDPNGGIHHGTALLICGIIAGNTWDGWLTEGRSGNRVVADKESVLRARDYFFHVPWPPEIPEEERSHGAYRYPVVLSFQHWSFPHDRPPPGWSFNPDLSTGNPPLIPVPSISSVSQAFRDRDISCRLSGYQDGIERAHLCPRSEAQWFTQEDMDIYNISRSLVGPGAVDDMANALAVRSDIHSLFDTGTFAFTRKLEKWVSHFLTPTFNLGPEYHNTIIDVPTSVNTAFLLARLAWAIFPGLQNFLVRGEKRLVILKQGIGEASHIKELEQDELYRRLGIMSGRRGDSPKKRRRADDNTESIICEADAVERVRLNSQESTQPVRSPISILPALSNLGSVGAVSMLSPVQPYEPTTWLMPSARQEVTERRRMTVLRQHFLKVQRPSDPALYCCDYNAAEEAIAAGREGPRKHGGAHLCMECLGADY